jgi:prepilin-type N-terminal cleavage/methylation domain-containing protein
MHTRHHSAFTLIELSMVLVIIALLVGGILVGRDLIHAASIRSTVSYVEKLNMAVNTFRSKYNCIPGDCPAATRFFASATQPDAVSNGNGNQLLSEDLGNVGYQNTERSYFFDHLAVSRLINLPTFDETAAPAGGFTYPRPSIGSSLIASSPQTTLLNNPNALSAGNYFYIGLVPDLNDGWFSANPPVLKAPDAYSIDAKMDDGKPLTGRVRAMSKGLDGDDPQLTSHITLPSATADACVTTATGNPYAALDTGLCSISIRAAF